MSHSIRLLLVWIVGALAFLAGCSRVPLHAPPAQLEGGLVVKVYDAYARDDRVFVKSMVTNGGPQAVTIDRDGWALRLPDGTVLPRAVGRTTLHSPYVLQPGETREVYVDFHQDDAELEALPSAMLIIGGISFGAEMPRVVGEIPLSKVPPYAEMYGTAPPADVEPPPAPPATAPDVTATAAPTVEPAPADTAVPAPADTSVPAATAAPSVPSAPPPAAPPATAAPAAPSPPR
jgi:hypothetical protein